MGKPWIGVDLDRTLAHYDHWRGPLHIGEPIPPMVERIKQHLAMGDTVKVFTARVSRWNSYYAEERYEAANISRVVAEWTAKHVGVSLECTCVKDYDMVMLYDDRAKQVVPNTGVVVGEAT